MKHGAPKNPSKFPFIVVGNKCDLESERSIKSNVIEEWLSSNGIDRYFEISAKTGEQVNNLFLETVADVVKIKNSESSKHFDHLVSHQISHL